MKNPRTRAHVDCVELDFRGPCLRGPTRSRARTHHRGVRSFLSSISAITLRCKVSALAALLCLAACREPTQDASGPIALGVEVDVTSDPGRGVPNAEISLHGTTIAVSDAVGHVAVTVNGDEGDVVELGVRCPAGYESPAKPLLVSIRRLSSGSRAPHFDARCAPMLRTVVVGLRAERGPNLPILHLGREVARTDSAGAALVPLSVKPGEHVSLVFDTKSGAPKGARLLPENPSVTFVAKDYDDFVVLDQRFEAERVAPSVPRGPVVTGPTRLTATR